MERMKIWIGILLLFSLTLVYGTAVFAQVPPVIKQDSAVITAGPEPAPVTSSSSGYVQNDIEEDDFSPGLFFMVTIGLFVMVLSAIAAIILCVVGLLFLFILAGIGIVSTSVIVGLQQKSFGKGFRTFLLLSFSTTGIAAGCCIAWILGKILKYEISFTLIGTGALGGLVAGLLIGWLASFAIRKVLGTLKSKWESRKQKKAGLVKY